MAVQSIIVHFRCIPVLLVTTYIFEKAEAQEPLPSHPIMKEPVTREAKRDFIETEFQRPSKWANPDEHIPKWDDNGRIYISACNATGYPKPEIKLQFRVNASYDWKDIEREKSFDDFPEPRFYLKGRFGQYRCKAFAGRHFATSPTYKVKEFEVENAYNTRGVFKDPENFKKVQVALGKPAKLACPQKHLPKGLKYGWRGYFTGKAKNNSKEIHWAFHINHREFDDSGGMYIVDDITGELLIPKVEPIMVISRFIHYDNTVSNVTYGCVLERKYEVYDAQSVVVYFWPIALEEIGGSAGTTDEIVRAPSPLTFVKPPYDVDWALQCVLGENNVTWFKDKVKIGMKNDTRYYTSPFGRVLTIVNATEKDKGVYTCKNYKHERKITVNVETYPRWMAASKRISMIPDMMYVPHGLKNLTLKCNVKHAKKVTWEIGGEKHPGLTNGLTVTIPTIDKQTHANSVSCTADNQHGSIKAWTALNVYHRTKFLRANQSRTWKNTFLVQYDVKFKKDITLEVQTSPWKGEQRWMTVDTSGLPEWDDSGGDPAHIAYLVTAYTDLTSDRFGALRISPEQIIINRTENMEIQFSEMPAKFRVVATTQRKNVTIFEDVTFVIYLTHTVTSTAPGATATNPEITITATQVITTRPEVTTTTQGSNTATPEITTTEITTGTSEVITTAANHLIATPEVTTTASNITTTTPEITTTAPEITTATPRITTTTAKATDKTPKVMTTTIKVITTTTTPSLWWVPVIVFLGMASVLFMTAMVVCICRRNARMRDKECDLETGREGTENDDEEGAKEDEQEGAEEDGQGTIERQGKEGMEGENQKGADEKGENEGSLKSFQSK